MASQDITKEHYIAAQKGLSALNHTNNSFQSLLAFQAVLITLEPTHTSWTCSALSLSLLSTRRTNLTKGQLSYGFCGNDNSTFDHSAFFRLILVGLRLALFHGRPNSVHQRTKIGIVQLSSRGSNGIVGSIFA